MGQTSHDEALAKANCLSELPQWQSPRGSRLRGSSLEWADLMRRRVGRFIQVDHAVLHVLGQGPLKWRVPGVFTCIDHHFTSLRS